ncbi:DUF99 domain-containing protein [Thermoplasma sp. Kam2015]|uniref:endonuclease dU n=1 Tax=Thermoplasma sp. Kam2015 TaxID=2094122 RepID=UPI000D96C279|nr:DUF99 family protein [Thermoplasma sp. Kam2015]PYB69164.1 DUF99 domain-containing protein [Thermoplasma sp. Kam2015]
MTDGMDDHPRNSLSLEYEPLPEKLRIKRGMRILGVDDSPFRRGDSESSLIGVLMRIDGYLEAIQKDRVHVDGNDVNEAIARLFRKTGSLAKVIMMSGISFAGFNICDIDSLHRELGVPVISLFEPGGSVEKMIRAIEKHLRDEEKVRILRSLKPVEIRNNGYVIMANLSGIDPRSAQEIIERNTLRGKFPEAVRIADLVGRISVT